MALLIDHTLSTSHCHPMIHYAAIICSYEIDDDTMFGLGCSIPFATEHYGMTSFDTLVQRYGGGGRYATKFHLSRGVQPQPEWGDEFGPSPSVILVSWEEESWILGPVLKHSAWWLSQMAGSTVKLYNYETRRFIAGEYVDWDKMMEEFERRQA